MNDLSQGILTNSLGAWKMEQESDSSEAEEGNTPTGNTADSSLLRNDEEVVEEGLPQSSEGPRYSECCRGQSARTTWPCAGEGKFGGR